MIRNFTIALASAALLVAPAAQAAEEKGQPVGVTVADLDLTTQQGREELDRRIDLAAKEVCGMNDTVTGSRVASRESRRCYRDAKAQMETHFAGVIENKQLGG